LKGEEEMRGHVFESLTLIKINKLIINIYIKKKTSS